MQKVEDGASPRLFVVQTPLSFHAACYVAVLSAESYLHRVVIALKANYSGTEPYEKKQKNDGCQLICLLRHSLYPPDYTSPLAHGFVLHMPGSIPLHS